MLSRELGAEVERGRRGGARWPGLGELPIRSCTMLLTAAPSGTQRAPAARSGSALSVGAVPAATRGGGTGAWMFFEFTRNYGSRLPMKRLVTFCPIDLGTALLLGGASTLI